MNAHVLEPGPQDPHCSGRCFTILWLKVLPAAKFLGNKHRVCLCILVMLFCEQLSIVFSFELRRGSHCVSNLPIVESHIRLFTRIACSLPITASVPPQMFGC